MAKTPITESKLRGIILAELRKHPDCDHVNDVIIVRESDRQPREPNWRASWGRSAQKAAPPLAYEIARRLQADYELAD